MDFLLSVNSMKRPEPTRSLSTSNFPHPAWRPLDPLKTGHIYSKSLHSKKGIYLILVGVVDIKKKKLIITDIYPLMKGRDWYERDTNSVMMSSSQSPFHFRQTVWECVKLPTWTQNNEENASIGPEATERFYCFHMQYSLCVCVRGSAWYCVSNWGRAKWNPNS